MIDMNVKLTKIVNRMNNITFVTFNPNTNSTNSDNNNACATANVANFNHLLKYQLNAELGIDAGFLKSMKKLNTNKLTNSASDKIYGAVESR